MGLGLDPVRLDQRRRRRPGVGRPRQSARLRRAAADAPGIRRLPAAGGRRRWAAHGRRARWGRTRDPGGAGSAHPAFGGTLGARRLRRAGGRHGRLGEGGGAMARMVRMVAVGIAAAAVSGAAPAGATGAAPVAYVVMDADSGTVLAERDAHKRWPPASMAKMMTVLIAMERVRDRSERNTSE